MELEAARNLKRKLLEGLARIEQGDARQISVGISGHGDSRHLQVRFHGRLSEEAQKLIDGIQKEAKGEVAHRHVGPVSAPPRKHVRPSRKDRPWQRRSNRPLLIGCSLACDEVPYGTLACFVRRRGEEGVFVLSNNHVLANENKAPKGAPVLQPGAWDTRDPEAAKVGQLWDFVALKKTGNVIDAAVARLDLGVHYDASQLRGLGKTLAGVRKEPLRHDEPVFKVGRTSGLRQGRVSALELEGIGIDYNVLGSILFDHQIEVSGEPHKPFSEPGDSGSLVVDADGLAVGLLFSGSDAADVAYVNPIHAVLSGLNLELLH